MQKLKDLISEIKTGFKDLLYPKNIKCIFCDDEITEENYNCTCNNCFKILENQQNNNICTKCGSFISKDDKSVCFNCKRNNFDYEYARSCYEYSGIVKHAIYKFKYKKAMEFAEHFGTYMAEYFNNLNWNIDIVTSVPLHEKQLKERSFNQATLLALIFCKHSILPFEELAIRIKPTKSQTKMTSAQRKENIKNAFELFDGRKTKTLIKNKNILIIDDVYTTGATTNELAKLLKSGGADKIYVLTLAHTKLQPHIGN